MWWYHFGGKTSNRTSNSRMLGQRARRSSLPIITFWGKYNTQSLNEGRTAGAAELQAITWPHLGKITGYNASTELSSPRSRRGLQWCESPPSTMSQGRKCLIRKVHDLLDPSSKDLQPIDPAGRRGSSPVLATDRDIMPILEPRSYLTERIWANRAGLGCGTPPNIPRMIERGR